MDEREKTGASTRQRRGSDSEVGDEDVTTDSPNLPRTSDRIITVRSSFPPSLLAALIATTTRMQLNLSSLPDDILLAILAFQGLADVLTFPLVRRCNNLRKSITIHRRPSSTADFQSRSAVPSMQ